MNKPKFDPNKPFEAVKPKFDPSQSFEDASSPGVQAIGVPDGQTPAGEEKLSDKISKLAKSGVQGFGQGASMGYLPQLQALAEPALTKVGDVLTGQNQSAELPDYVTRRDQAIKALAREKAENPKTFGISELAGNVASGLAMPGGAAAKGASIPARLAMGAGTGALLSGVQNPGDVEGKVNPLQMGERVDNAKVGAAFGGAFPALGVAGEMAGPTLKSWAEKQAFKQMGPYARDAIKAFAKDRVNSIGRTLLDKKVVGGIPTNYTGLAERAENAMGKTGQGIADYVGDLGVQASKIGNDVPGTIVAGTPPSTTTGISRKALADAIRKDMISPHTDLPGVSAKNAQVEKLLQHFENSGEDLIDIPAAWEKSKAIGKEVNWDRLPGADVPIEEQVQRKLYGKTKQGMTDAADAVETLNPGSGVEKGKFKALNSEYANLADATKIAEKRDAKTFANRFLSPSDYGVTMGGAAIGAMTGDDFESRLKNAILGAGAGLAHKVGRQYGYQVTAPILDKTGGAMSRLNEINPWLINSLLKQKAGDTDGKDKKD